MSWQLSSIDDRKTLQVGDFRLDARRNNTPSTVSAHTDVIKSHSQLPVPIISIAQLPYKKSDAFLFDILENICRAMSDYHVTKGKSTLDRSQSI